ncbi:MAG TPA: enolase C-terminal domain-like protein [Marmoricola sp.]|nr:enolase C-terminal domain-like protein [Marmoricola sp.]
MKLTSLDAAAYRVPTDGPEADGTFAWDSTTVVVVEASAEGAVGAGWTFAPAAAVAVVDELLTPVLRDRDVAEVERCWEDMVRAVRNAGRPGLVGMALSAVDIALWDLRGRVEERTLSELWGVSAARVEAYGSGGFTTYDAEQLDAQVADWLALGLRHVKIKIGESWGSRVQRDLDRTEQVRRAVGEDVEVFVDANGAYSAEQAGTVGRVLDGLGVAWFEEPVSSDDLAGLDEVRHRVQADVAAGEYGYDEAYLARMAPYVDCLQLDVTRCGGYTGWRRAVSALPAGTALSAHCAPYVTVPVAATTPGLRHVEWFHDHVRIAQDLFDGYADPVGGVLRPAAEPGHGLHFRSQAAEQFRVA